MYYKNFIFSILSVLVLTALFSLIYIIIQGNSYPYTFITFFHSITPVIICIFTATFALTSCGGYEFSNPYSSTGEEIVYFHPDYLGSITMVSDNTGQKIAEYHYDPFGKLLLQYSGDPSIVKYKYTAQEEDSGTGLYYCKARFYDPEIGRFISPDTIIPDPLNTQSYNRYSYVYNNPIGHVDITGHWPGENFFNNIIDTIQDGWQNFTSGINNIINSVGNGISQVWNNTENVIKQHIMNPVKEKWSETIGSKNWWHNQWEDWLKKTIVTIGIASIVILVAFGVGVGLGIGVGALSMYIFGVAAIMESNLLFLIVTFMAITIGGCAGYLIGKYIGDYLLNKAGELFGTRGYFDKDSLELAGMVSGGIGGFLGTLSIIGFVGSFYQWYILYEQIKEL